MIKTFTITAEHIKNGKPRESCKCPFALCLRENGYETASVGVLDSDYYSIYFHQCSLRKTIVPRDSELGLFIQAVDDGNPVEPITVELEIDPEIDKIIESLNEQIQP